VEDEKNPDQGPKQQKLKDEVKHSLVRKLFCLQNKSRTRQVVICSSKNQFIQASQMTFLKPIKKQVLPQATQASILSVKGAQRPSTHS